MKIRYVDPPSVYYYLLAIEISSRQHIPEPICRPNHDIPLQLCACGFLLFEKRAIFWGFFGEGGECGVRGVRGEGSEAEDEEVEGEGDGTVCGGSMTS